MRFNAETHSRHGFAGFIAMLNIVGIVGKCAIEKVANVLGIGEGEGVGFADRPKTTTFIETLCARVCPENGKFQKHSSGRRLAL